MARNFTLFILLGMALGLAAGAACHFGLPAAAAQKDAAGYFSLITDSFLRLIKMIIAPLVFSTLVSGIAHMGEGSAIGRVGLKTLGWFLVASLVSLVLGVATVTLLAPGAGLHLIAPATEASSATTASDLSLKAFLAHVFPTSIVDAMARNEILQIVVFAGFAGAAMAALGDRVSGLLALLEQVAQLMLKITNYVMTLAPLAVFSAIAATVTTHGFSVLGAYAAFVGSFYVGLLILWSLFAAAAFATVGKRVTALARGMRQPALLAFSTATSEAAYPRTLEALEAFGVSKRVASFVLPLGYSFNLTGSMMYCTFASLFIAQAYGVHLGAVQVATMVLMLMVTSKGIAGVPRAAIVVIQATLPSFHIPDAGIALVLAVDYFLDMGRSATNVVGNAVAAVAVGKWENELGETTADLDAAALPTA